nr:copia protein [Tanacetum cinerariifolium]
MYVCQPEGFIDADHPSHVYKLKKALYGLKQSIRAWYDELLMFLLHNQFFKGTIDPTLFIRCFDNDILVAKPTEKHLKEVKRIFCYLWGIVNTGLWYTKDSGFELTGFLDADYAGCKDTFKSTSGGAQFLNEKLVSIDDPDAAHTVDITFASDDSDEDDTPHPIITGVHLLGWQTLIRLYGFVDALSKKQPLDGLALSLWGDLKIMLDTLEVDFSSPV